MKHSPRTWLLTRHTAATPALDAARLSALEAALRESAPVPASRILPALFLPNRRLWSALAAAWALLAAVHFSQRPPAGSAPALSRSEIAARADWLRARETQLHALLR